jgi:misacylated tRNA(Ala) deacylase
MRTRLLYQEDSYLKEFEAVVLYKEGNKVVLDQTAFHPLADGLDSDTGKIIVDNKETRVLEVIKDKDLKEVVHILENPDIINEGEKIKGIIDWERRYRMMRLHTAAHIVEAILFERFGVKITGGHITPEYAKKDFDLAVSNWKEIIEEAVAEANKIVEKEIEVKIYYLSREEALNIPGIVKLATRLPPSVDKLRIVEIPGVDIQADGGPHVKNTREIGKIKILQIDNRGKHRRRLYFTVEP